MEELLGSDPFHPHTHKLTELKNTSPQEAILPLYLFIPAYKAIHHTTLE